jgi:hypothetical protein
MKSRCCSCRHVFIGNGACPKCGSNAVEALVPREAVKHGERNEGATSSGPRDLMEVPEERNHLFG